jgi:hypothetical protein
MFCIHKERKLWQRPGKDAMRPGHFGGILMRWPWIREAKLIEPRPVINPKILELQTAKEILAEVFHARPGPARWRRRFR